MKNIAVIFLLGLYVFGTTEACQLLKLPALFSHFREHKIQTGSTESFIEYLSEHYSSGTKHSEDHQNDDRLPFKTIDECCLVSHVSLPFNEISVQVPTIYQKERSYPSHKDDSYIRIAVGKIFQPPRC